MQASMETNLLSKMRKMKVHVYSSLYIPHDTHIFSLEITIVLQMLTLH